MSSGSDTNLHYVGDSTNYQIGFDRASDSHITLGLGANYELKQGVTSTVSYERLQANNSRHADTLKLNVKVDF